MVNFVVLLKKNLLEMVRNKRIIIFSILFVAISVISALTARFLPELINAILETAGEQVGANFLLKATVAESYIQFIVNISQSAVLVVAILFATSISKEKNKGTYNNLVSLGVKDKDIVLAHFVSQIIVISISYLLGVAVFVVLNILLFNQIMGIRGVVSLLYLYLLLIATMSVTLFISCVCNKNSKAYLFVIIWYFVVTFIEVIPKFNLINPMHLMTLGSELMYYPDYTIKYHLITSIITVLISVSLVVLAVYFSKNKVNNHKKVSYYDKPEGI